MKRKLLIMVLCVLCVNAFAQKRTTKKSTRKSTTASKQAATTGSQTMPGSAPLQQPSVTDTTKKQAALAAKPFDRPLDGYYKKSNILSAKVTPYAPLREADVAFRKRVWEEIDVREKMNQYMASPKGRLIDILMEAIDAGELTAYDPTPNPKENDPGGDAFSRPLKPGEAKARMADSSLVEKRDENNNVVSSKMTAGEFNPDSIVRFRIKEDWVFDKQRSVYEPRIIGIAPLIKPKAVAGVELDLQPAFWIYFPEARQILATKEVVNRNNDATGLSYDDVFMKRIFASYVVKQSNDKDERVKDYAQGIDRLYESQRIKKALMDWELDLWQY
jgi:gliding motility associated protien GldN